MNMCVFLHICVRVYSVCMHVCSFSERRMRKRVTKAEKKDGDSIYLFLSDYIFLQISLVLSVLLSFVRSFHCFFLFSFSLIFFYPIGFMNSKFLHEFSPFCNIILHSTSHSLKLIPAIYSLGKNIRYSERSNSVGQTKFPAALFSLQSHHNDRSIFASDEQESGCSDCSMSFECIWLSKVIIKDKQISLNLNKS